MTEEQSFRDVLRNALQNGDLRFQDFVGLALYHPRFGYYATSANPVGKGADFVTAPALSPAFAFALARLVREFVSRCEGGVCSIVDIGCGDGSLIRALARQVPDENVRFFGVDRALERAKQAERDEAGTAAASRAPQFFETIEQVPDDAPALYLSNELFDAFPFARLVKRGEEIHELYVTERDGALDWSERDAPPEYAAYFASHGIALDEGQFADVSLEWERFYGRLAARLRRGLIVTFDYGYPAAKLFHRRARRYGTAAAYRGHRVSRDLLADPGNQDLTAHINFSDLIRAGEGNGATTLFFDRMATFLLAVGITEHELFKPVHELTVTTSGDAIAQLEARDDARRLVLPDGIGEDLRVLVQSKLMGSENWTFHNWMYSPSHSTS